MKSFTAFFLAILIGGCTSVEKESYSTINLFKKAERNYVQGLLSEAEADYLKLSRIAPDVSEVWAKLGNIYVRTGYLEAAVRMYEKCLDINPQETRCWNNMALTRVKQAMETLQAGAKSLEMNSDEYYVLTELYSKLLEVVAIRER